MTPYQKLHAYASKWVSTCFKPFTIDDIKKSYNEKGNNIDELINTSGILAKQLKKEGLIFKNGFTTKTRPNGKEQIIVLWISKEYKQRQSNNAKGDKETLTINFENH